MSESNLKNRIAIINQRAFRLGSLVLKDGEYKIILLATRSGLISQISKKGFE